MKFGTQESKLYLDNVKIKDCQCSLTGVSLCIRCPSKMHSTSVDEVWLKKDIKKRAEATRKMLAEEKEDKEKAERFKTCEF